MTNLPIIKQIKFILYKVTLFTNTIKQEQMFIFLHITTVNKITAYIS